MNEEIWKDIEGYEGWYQVSNLGRVKSLKKRLMTHGKEMIVEREIILKPSLAGRGYLAINFPLRNGKREKRSVHQIVARAFIDNKDNLPQVDHINRNKTDNRIENLRWCSNKENHRNMDNNVMITAFGKTQCRLDWAREYGIAPCTISERIRRGWDIQKAISVAPNPKFISRK